MHIFVVVVVVLYAQIAVMLSSSATPKNVLRFIILEFLERSSRVIKQCQEIWNMPNLFTLNPFFVLLKNEMLCISLRLELSSAINYWHRIKSLIFQYLNVTERFKVPILSTLVNRGLCFPSKQSFLKLSMIRIFSAFR